ncbi:hypothetical protein BDV25DRAFT_161050 [Aspergillus avenaceus]|uniref:Uncharacterized protein n=1 Tax=Aspergillus avenaceus TaxID=36643 RepID=A0A5N6TL90_ASPAV|nr:hypothetical protein BDV25DRAFT_161050 [Aspergillus avenaceus]
MAGKIFGQSSGSVNAPIAAFSMALVLTSYCVSSIRTARREAQAPTTRQKTPSDKADQPSWVQQALEESREAEQRKKSNP